MSIRQVKRSSRQPSATRRRESGGPGAPHPTRTSGPQRCARIPAAHRHPEVPALGSLPYQPRDRVRKARVISPAYQPATVANNLVDFDARHHVERMRRPDTDRARRAESVDGSGGRESPVDSPSSLRN
jgi:hypothetical protein